MSASKKFVTSIIIMLFVGTNPAIAAKSKGTLQTFGDYAQIINPLVAATLASQEKGVGHFVMIFGQSTLITHAVKYTSGNSKWKFSKRPSIEGKKNRYDGMPSGHTNSAWVAASYIRTFSKENKHLSIPLYITAAVTGYSRVHAKKHTVSQVVAGAALAEIVTYINSKLDWSNEYKSTNFYIGGDGASISFKIKF